MKHPGRIRKLNKGFSLLEVLVTLAVISVLSIPLIRSFVNSARVNGKTKSIQNATDVAQNISEYFGVMSVDILKTKYDGKYTVLDDGRIVFNNITLTADGNIDYNKGSDSEKFYVSVVLDPTEYTGGDEGSIGEINDYKKPEINNTNESSSITCMTQITKYDASASAYFESRVSNFNKSKIFRKLTFYIYQIPFTDGRVRYHYSMKITYKYEGVTDTYDAGLSMLAYDIVPASMTKVPNLYIVYQPTFAAYTEELYTSITAGDKIEIHYYWDADDDVKDFNAYIITQQITNKAGAPINLASSNIAVYHGDNAVLNTALNKPGDTFHLYTNIPDWESGSITSGGDTYTTLYNMSVYVWKDINDGITIEDDTLSIKTGDCYATISTVKGD